MSFDPISAALDLGKVAIERIWPDPNKRAEEVRKLEELAQTGDLARLQANVTLLTGQMEINKVEAAHPSIFVSGWRPALGWVCVAAFAWQFVLFPFAAVLVVFVENAPELPTVATDQLFELVMGMLGLGGLRTFEKMKGKARN